MHHKTFIIKFCVPIIFIFITDVFSQTGWFQQYSGTTNTLNDVFFLNNNTGYMVGASLIIKTTNGGYNWFILSSSVGGREIQFLNLNTGYISGGTIYKTIDGGLNWINLNLIYINTIHFTDVNTGYAAGYNNTIMKTTNGGLSWMSQNISTPLNNFNAVYFTSSEIGYLVGGKMLLPLHGVIYKTTNGGNSWIFYQTQTLDVNFESVHFPTSNTGYIVGSYEYGNSGIILKTTNAGSYWSQQGVTSKDLHSTNFLNASTGFAVGDGGMIIKTIDGGVIWNSQLSGSTSNLRSVTFKKENTGYVAGENGIVQKTINGGISGPPFAVSGRITFEDNGQPVPRGYVKALRYNSNTNEIEVVDSTSIQSNGYYLLTDCPSDSLDIMAYDDDEIAFSFSGGSTFVPTYYVSTIHWQYSTTIYPRANMNDININVFRADTSLSGIWSVSGNVYANNSLMDFISLKDAYIYAKMNNSFKRFSVTNAAGRYNLTYLSPGYYEIIADRIGYNSASRFVTITSSNLDSINFYLDRTEPIGITINTSIIPEKFNLFQNYPNPFNPSTTINFDIPFYSFVNLNIFDITGKEIEVLFSGDLNPGQYSLIWNASSQPSGIYFYRLSNKVFSQTRKMILIK